MPTARADPVIELVARELKIPTRSVAATLELLDGGATVPFVARYRKEATGGLDELALRQIADRSRYLRELQERKRFVNGAIAEAGLLTPELARAIEACATKNELEELYAPFKSKRRTRGQIALELGLEPLANAIWNLTGSGSPEAQARSLIAENPEIGSVEAAFDGAVDICAERLAREPRARRVVQAELRRGSVRVKKGTKHRQQKTKFDSYDGYAEPVARIASHRYLAIARGEREGVLKLSFDLDDARAQAELEQIVAVRANDAWARLLRRAVEEALSRLLLPAARSAVRAELAERAELEAVRVFAKNLEQLLLAPPFGARWVLGIDPGQRTGCKWVVVDATGALIEHGVFNLVQGASAQQAAEQTLAAALSRHSIAAIAVGNGTHGRETESFVRSLLERRGIKGVICVSVNESGASVYSASDVARQELPDHDVTVRGAVSIARRLQDPLSELVKIDPRSVGVGQYQHDVSERLLSDKLGEVVESAVNRVGVELNTASPSLLAHVSGIGPKLAQRIVLHRSANGKFPSRKSLLKVSGLGAKTFEQAAGFLRVQGGEHPLDASGVHPERYGLVERMARDLGLSVAELVGNSQAAARIDRQRYLDDEVGEYTLDDILRELEKPGRDPRAEFQAPSFREDVRRIEDVTPGMVLEGRVTNVTAFGAFVDIGVHQDGLVHISALADRFVKDPSEVVGVGDLIRVRVLSVDLDRKRISLSAKGIPS
jgi:protein Tex